MRMFQFLLGRLETLNLKESKTINKMFQFLLGRLETEEYHLRITCYTSFQFLLGRLETQAGQVSLLPGQPVSIPLR